MISDDASGESLDLGGHAAYQQELIEDALQSHRQAFAILIHHAWEKHVCRILSVHRYIAQKAYGELEKHHGCRIDRRGLERLRLTANCIKHESAELHDKHPEMFDEEYLHLFDAKPTPSEKDEDKRLNSHGMHGSWADALRLKDEDVHIFIKAARVSASTER